MFSDIAVDLCLLQLREWLAHALSIVVHIGARIEVSGSSSCAYDGRVLQVHVDGIQASGVTLLAIRVSA